MLFSERLQHPLGNSELPRPSQAAQMLEAPNTRQQMPCHKRRGPCGVASQTGLSAVSLSGPLQPQPQRPHDNG